MKSSDRTKLIVAVVVLLIAGALFAWQLNLFGGGATTTPPPVEPSSLKAGGAHVAPGAKK